MRMHLTRPHELDSAAIARWRALQASDPALASPYFSPEYTLAVADVRDDVYVTLLEDEHRTVGFFPFQRRWGAGLPAGGRLSDHHGVVAAPDTRWNWYQLLRRSGLGYWQFDHLAAHQQPPGNWTHAVSHALDLSSGYAAYRQSKLQARCETLLRTERKIRKIEREVGPLRFVANTDDNSVLQTVFRLKLEKCRRTGAIEYFNWPWTRALVERIRAVDEPAFGGRLSALYVGDSLVAAHFGMRSEQVWHTWFSVYEPAWSHWSPGTMLMLKMAEAAAAQGHTVMDFGKGDEEYKKALGNGGLLLAEGCLSRTSVPTLVRTTRKGVGRLLRASGLMEPVRSALQALRWPRAV
jgi:CelD/BcsL family acetyltransferase involved in cellulose biosynthesis